MGIMKKQLLLIAAIGLCSTSILGMSKTNAVEEPQKSSDKLGLLGYYYQSTDFKKVMMIAPMTGNVLGYEQEAAKDLLTEEEMDFQSVRWLGRIQVDKTDEYEFKLTHDELASIEIDGKLVSKLGKEKIKIKLEKDKLYEIKIEYRLSENDGNKSNLLNDLKLIKVSTNGEEIVSLNDLHEKSPNSEEKKQSKNNKALDGLSLSKVNYDDANEDREDEDDDNDGIPNVLERNGYTVQRKITVKWKDEYASKNYKKYLSDPSTAYTTGDPFTDLEKVLGNIDPATKKEAYDPRVAAYPNVNVTLEKVILSDTSKVTDGLEVGTKAGSTDSTVHTTTGEVDIFPLPGMKISHSLQKSSTTIAESDNSNSSSTTSFNAENAHLNANIRYNNTGTGAIHNAQPTITFTIHQEAISTILAENNTTAEIIVPGQSYPKKGQAPIALLTSDQFNSNPITLNKGQYSALLDQAPLLLTTNQVKGYFVTKSESGSLSLGSEWTPYKNQIDERTFSIVIVEKDGMVSERKIVGTDSDNPDDSTPKVTFREAFKLGYGKDITEDSAGNIFYKGEQITHEKLVIDRETADEIQSLVKDQPVESIFDLTLAKGMNFNIYM